MHALACIPRSVRAGSVDAPTLLVLLFLSQHSKFAICIQIVECCLHF